MKHLDGLNLKQHEAVIHSEGPLLILAGAGAGKTRVIVHRILHLIHSGVAPKEILAVTFTNKAAKEMRERIDGNIAVSEGLPTVSTFHSLGVKILREQSSILKLPKQFNIFDRTDSVKAVRDALVSLGYDPKQYEPRQILGTISKQKGDGITPDEYEEIASHGQYGKIVAPVWRKYEKTLRNEGSLDFDDLLVKTVRLLEVYPEIKDKYQRRWKYIHVDEYQDTNRMQYTLIQLLAGDKKNVCAVGDVDQNIYSWRGASIENILRFEKDFPKTRVILLEQNYRSTKVIVAVSNTIIEKNTKRPKKNLFTENEEGDKPILYGAYDEHDEARFVVETVESLSQKGVPYSKMAVLYRTNFQSRVLEDTFVYHDIPYRLIGTKFFERKEVKDILSFIKASRNPESITDISRIINIPARGIGKVTLLKIIEKRQNELNHSVKQKVDNFFALLKKIKEKTEEEKPSLTIKFIIQEAGFEKYYKKRGTEEDNERLENLYELVTLAGRYDHLLEGEGIEKLLEEAALATDQDEMDTTPKKGVTLMTVHASKGLEFDYIFITGLEDGLFPHERIDSDEYDDEEERRLFYVALTRARKKIFLSYASSRTIYGSRQINVPSDFLNDIDSSMLEVVDEDGIQMGGDIEVKTVYLE